MVCSECDYYEEGVTDYGPYNKCNLLGYEYFITASKENEIQCTMNIIDREREN